MWYFLFSEPRSLDSLQVLVGAAVFSARQISWPRARLFTGVWSYGTVESRHHDNHHQHHHRLSLSTSSNRLVYCRQNDDCQQSDDALKGGETCHWLYEGCAVGICMCDPLNQKRHPHTGKCIPGEKQCHVSPLSSSNDAWLNLRLWRHTIMLN